MPLLHFYSNLFDRSIKSKFSPSPALILSKNSGFSLAKLSKQSAKTCENRQNLLRTLFYCKTHSRPPSQNPSENPFPRTLPRAFSEPFSERCVAVRPLRRAPYRIRLKFRGGANRVFGKPCSCPPPKKGRFDENGENDEFAFYPLKRRASLLRPPKTTSFVHS